jgi:hypothetical protein
VSDTFTTITDTMSNQQNLITSFSSLMMKLEPLIKIGDEVAKVCSLRIFCIGQSELSIFSKRSILTSISHGKCLP